MSLATEHLGRTAGSSRADGLVSVTHRRCLTVSLATETLALLLPAMIFALVALGRPEVKAPESTAGDARREIHPLRPFADHRNTVAGRR